MSRKVSEILLKVLCGEIDTEPVEIGESDEIEKLVEFDKVDESAKDRDSKNVSNSEYSLESRNMKGLGNVSL